MLKDVYKYFEDLEKNNHVSKGGSISFDKKRMAVIDKCNVYGIRSYEVIIDGTRYFAKDLSEIRSIAEIASSQMYNDIGVTTPPVSTVELPPKGLFKNGDTILINQDLRSIRGLEFVSAMDFFKKKDVTDFLYKNIQNRDKWAPLYNDNTRIFFEKFMSRECYDDLIALMLVDELRSERDRHCGNYFFYKNKGGDKFQGVVPIDNEMMAVADYERFEDMLYIPYSSPTLLGLKSDNKDYAARVRDIKEIIQDGALSPSQINLIRKEINYDLPKVVKEVGSKSAFKRDRKSTYDLIAPLWEYNNKELDREL